MKGGVARMGSKQQRSTSKNIAPGGGGPGSGEVIGVKAVLRDNPWKKTRLQSAQEIKARHFDPIKACKGFHKTVDPAEEAKEKRDAEKEKTKSPKGKKKGGKKKGGRPGSAKK